jgi:hypothetical protein
MITLNGCKYCIISQWIISWFTHYTDIVWKFLNIHTIHSSCHSSNCDVLFFSFFWKFFFRSTDVWSMLLSLVCCNIYIVIVNSTTCTFSIIKHIRNFYTSTYIYICTLLHLYFIYIWCIYIFYVIIHIVYSLFALIK